MPEMVITQHAMERVAKRIVPGASLDEARRMLEQATTSARRLRQKTPRGQTMWEVAEPPMRLVTKYDPRVGVVIVTVFDPVTSEPIDDGEEEAIAARAAAPSAAPVERQPKSGPVPARHSIYLRQGELANEARELIRLGQDATAAIQAAEDHLATLAQVFSEDSEAVRCARRAVAKLRKHLPADLSPPLPVAEAAPDLPPDRRAARPRDRAGPPLADRHRAGAERSRSRRREDGPARGEPRCRAPHPSCAPLPCRRATELHAGRRRGGDLPRRGLGRARARARSAGTRPQRGLAS